MAARNEVSVIIRAKDLASRVFTKFQRSFRALRRVVLSGTRAVATFTAGVTAAVLALGKLASRGQEVLDVQTAFARVAGENSVRALNKLRDASDGLISKYDLMTQFNRALTLGAVDNVDAYAKLVAGTTALARAQGLAVDQGLEKFTLGLSRQSSKLLDDLGVTLKAAEAYAIYGQRVGKAASELTDSEKALAFRTVALERMEAAVQSLGEAEQKAGIQVRRGVTALKDFRDQLALMVNESPAVGKFFEEIANFGIDIVDALNGDIDIIVDAFGAAGQVVGNAFLVAFLESVQGLNEKLADAVPLVGDLIFGSEAREIQESIDAALANLEANRVRLDAAARAGRAQAEARAQAAGGGGGGGGGGGAGAAPFVVDAAGIGRVAGLPGPGAVAGGVTVFDGLTEQGANMVGLPPAAEEFSRSADIAIASLGAMGEAAIEGTNTVAASVNAMVQNIFRSLRAGSGPGSFLGGIGGAFLGAGLGLVGALFTRRDTPKVDIRRFEPQAERQLRQNTGPERVTVQILGVDGKPIAQVQKELNDRQRRDAIDRTPLGVTLPGAA